MDSDNTAQLIRRKMEESIECLCIYISSNKQDKEEDVEKLLSLIPDLDITIAWEGMPEVTALCVACSCGNSDFVTALLRRGADPDVCTTIPALCLAVSRKTGNLKMVDDLLGYGARVNVDDRVSGRTALHRACESNNFEVVKYLVDAGACVNDPGSNTSDDVCFPLKIAGCNGNVGMVKYLVEQGADIEDSMQDILEWSMSNKNTQMLECLVELGGKVGIDDFVYFVYMNEDRNMLKAVLDFGIDINAVDAEGDTPLHAACVSDCTTCEMLEFLIKNGADVSLISPRTHRTLLHEATKMLDCNKLKCLLNLKVELNAKSRRDNTAVGLALLYMAKLNREEARKQGMVAAQLLASAGAHVTKEVCRRAHQAALDNQTLSLEERNSVLEFLDSMQQPKRLVQLCCIEIRSLVPAPVSKSASQLSGILPDFICAGLFEFHL